jgi:exodeoxyribonuclease VII large subunit
MPEVSFIGEISSVTKAGSGHLYFTLKDAKSQIGAVMWSSGVRALKFAPEAGLSVVCFARPNVYPASGKLQMIVHRMAPAGAGELQRKFQELKSKLEKEGFFAAERKRPIPFFPKAVGVVTSRQGAVIHDIMVKISERMPNMKVYLVDVRVQGEGAAAEIAAGLDFLDASGLVDVIIVGRGGGSLEDLWAFNEEAVVKAVFRCRTPVVSGVGHEVDVTLCDLAADLRAPTPTAAAERVVPRRSELLERLDGHRRRFDDYGRWFLPLTQRLDEFEGRLERRTAGVFEEAKLHLRAARARIETIRPARIIETLRGKLEVLCAHLARGASRDVAGLAQQVERLERRLSGGAESASQRAARRLDALAGRLAGLNPRKVLERGFSMVESDGHIVTAAEQLAVGERVKIVFSRGNVGAQVTDKG